MELHLSHAGALLGKDALARDALRQARRLLADE